MYRRLKPWGPRDWQINEKMSEELKEGDALEQFLEVSNLRLLFENLDGTQTGVSFLDLGEQDFSHVRQVCV